jgi:hypothetical protein
VALVDWDLNPAASIERLVEGTAHRPYARRALAPALVRGLAVLAPRDGEEPNVVAVEPAKRRDRLRHATAAYRAALVLLTLTLFGFAVALRYLLGAFTDDRTAALAALGAIALVPAFYAPVGYLYDLPHLALFTLALALLAHRRFGLLLALLPLVALSKETAVLLPFLFALLERARLDSPRYRRLLIVQIGTCVGIEALLRAAVASRPGSPAEWHLFDHNLPLLLGQLPAEEVESAGPALLFLALLGAAIVRRSAAPRFLRVALWMGTPLLALGLFFGYVEEVRQYMELYPVLVGLIVAARTPSAAEPAAP